MNKYQGVLFSFHCFQSVMLASYLPVIEDGETESLSLSVRAQIRFESERVHDWNEGLDEVQGRAWDGSVLCHVATTLCQHLNGDVAMNEITVDCLTV